MKRVLRYFRIVDYAVAVGSLGWGLLRFSRMGSAETWTSALWVGSGLLGFLIARWNLATKFQAFIEKRFVKRSRDLPSEPGPFPEPPREVYQPRRRTKS
jgi:hypothetical protein